jgi:hypothetical protein
LWQPILKIATNIKGYNENTKRNRKLSQFAIGKIKHMPYYKKNIHTMAAYLIGLRALA